MLRRMSLAALVASATLLLAALPSFSFPTTVTGGGEGTAMDGGWSRTYSPGPANHKVQWLWDTDTSSHDSKLNGYVETGDAMGSGWCVQIALDYGIIGDARHSDVRIIRNCDEGSTRSVVGFDDETHQRNFPYLPGVRAGRVQVSMVDRSEWNAGDWDNMLVNKVCYYPPDPDGHTDAQCGNWNPVGNNEWANRAWYRDATGDNSILNRGGDVYDPNE